MTAIAERPERISLHGEWNQGKVPVYALGKLDRYTRRTVSRMWHALTRAHMVSAERNVLRSQIRDLQSVIELVQPQWPAVSGTEEGAASPWVEVEAFDDARRSLTHAMTALSVAADELLSLPAPDARRQFGQKAIPAGAVPPGGAREQGVATLLRDIETAMHTIFTVGKSIHEEGLTTPRQDNIDNVPVAEPSSPQAPQGLTFLGRQARSARVRATAKV